MKSAFNFCCLLCLLVIAGCGDKGGAASGTPSEMLLGKWDATTEKAPPDVSMQMEFSSDGAVTITTKQGAQSKTERGGWRILSEEGQTLAMEMSIKAEGPKKFTATFQDSNSATLEAEGESEKVALDRVQ